MKPRSARPSAAVHVLACICMLTCSCSRADPRDQSPPAAATVAPPNTTPSARSNPSASIACTLDTPNPDVYTATITYTGLEAPSILIVELHEPRQPFAPRMGHEDSQFTVTTAAAARRADGDGQCSIELRRSAIQPNRRPEMGAFEHPPRLRVILVTSASFDVCEPWNTKSYPRTIETRDLDASSFDDEWTQLDVARSYPSPWPNVRRTLFGDRGADLYCKTDLVPRYVLALVAVRLPVKDEARRTGP